MDVSYVYFIRAIGTDRIKIGYTASSIKGRIASLTTASPFDLECEFLLPSDEPLELEKQIHMQLHKFRRKGEWFEINTGALGSFLKMFYSWRVTDNHEIARITGTETRKPAPFAKFDLDELSFWKTYNEVTYYPMWIHQQLLGEKTRFYLDRQARYWNKAVQPLAEFIAKFTIYPAAFIWFRILKPSSKLVF